MQKSNSTLNPFLIFKQEPRQHSEYARFCRKASKKKKKKIWKVAIYKIDYIK